MKKKIHMNDFLNSHIMFWGLAWNQLELKTFPFKSEGVDSYKWVQIFYPILSVPFYTPPINTHHVSTYLIKFDFSYFNYLK